MPEGILIAYYSWSGSIAKLARMIQAEVGGELFGIEPVSPYASDYNAVVAQAKKEIQANHRPALCALPDVSRYDAILLGSPNWWSTVAPPVATFLEGVDLTNKTVAPFLSHGGGGEGRMVRDIRALCPASNVLSALTAYGSASKNDVAAWLNRIGLANK